MKILKALLFIVLSVFTIDSFAQPFKINGHVEGVVDGTWLFLKTTDEIKLDSCQVTNNAFAFTGRIEQATQQVILHDAKFSNYVIFWLEPKTIQITVKSGEFRKAIIKGSTSQDENNRLTKLIEPYRLKIDSLTGILKTYKNDSERIKSTFDALKTARQKEQEAYMNYVRNNPDNLIAAHVLKVYATSWGKEKASELYQNFSTEMKNSDAGKNIYNYISLSQDISVGKKYADFEQSNSKGEQVKLSQIKGKYILLEFWASWCGPCRGENPNLVKTYLAYKDKGFEILGVSADNNKDAWLKAIQEDKLPWENVSDLKGDQNSAALIYGVYSFPTNYLIDQNGIVIAKNLRGEDLKRKLAELLP